MYLKLIIIIFISLLLEKSCFSQPQTEWVKRFNSPGNYNDYVTDMAIDNSGSVYLTGYINVNDTNQNYVTIKYNSNGIEQWVRYYDGPDHREDKPGAIAVDDSGNVVVTGYSYSYSEFDDFLTIKYNSNGDFLWVKKFIGIGHVSDRPNAMTIDKMRNVYITGSGVGINSIDILTIMYNSRGSLIWNKYYDGAANSFDVPFSINIDDDSNIYIVGQTTINRFLSRVGVVIKYSESGNLEWVRNSLSSIAIFSVLNNTEFVYMVGHSEQNNNTDINTLKFDSSGSLLWERKYNRSDSVPDQDDFFRSFTLDKDNNPIFTCINSDNLLRWDIATVKYNSNGNFVWAKIFGESSSNDESKSITSDKFGDIYVCGAKDNGLFAKYLMLKYNSIGSLLWAITYDNNFPFGSHSANKILTDTLGNIYVTGISHGNNTGTDIATIKYSQLTKIVHVSEIIPNVYKLFQNYPNPFNPITTINYELPIVSNVAIKVYNILGKEINLLINEKQNAGKYEFEFDGSDLSSGIYFYSLEINGVIIDTKKLILSK
ncbi:MAG: SBBP repeat-containing protein [Bacteroidota bacterium]|nr:SBBP repeat-containing protein [Bacteroidota bacterium]